LTDYWWFCPEHAAEYNKSWNYYSGLSTEEIMAEIKRDETWRVDTFKFGLNLGGKLKRGDVDDPFELFGMFMAPKPPPAPPVSPEEEAALRRLGLAPHHTAAELKRAYKKQALALHPDMHGGDKDKEREFKELVEAYNFLLKKKGAAV